MKKYWFAIIIGCLGICAGFTLCYIYLLLPTQAVKLEKYVPPVVLQHGQLDITVGKDGSLYLNGNQRISVSQMAAILHR